MSTSGHHHHGANRGSADALDWDARYASAEQLWSGDPNGALVSAVAGLTPGRALDVGCGEGADAVWLARHGWHVTGVDVSRVALERAARHAGDAGVSVDWVHSGLVEARLTPATFDLVSAQYPVLEKSPGLVAEHILLDAVAPGGTLVFVHHADFQFDDPDHPGFNPADYVGPWDLAALLDDEWVVVTNETRPRHVTAGAGAGHTEDVVLVARRTDSRKVRQG